MYIVYVQGNSSQHIEHDCHLTLNARFCVRCVFPWSTWFTHFILTALLTCFSVFCSSYIPPRIFFPKISNIEHKLYPHITIICGNLILQYLGFTFPIHRCLSQQLAHLKKHEPGHEKMCLMSYANNKGADQPAYPRSLISAFVLRCLDSIISLESIVEMSRLSLASVAAQAGLSLFWSETPEDTFCRVVAHVL